MKCNFSRALIAAFFLGGALSLWGAGQELEQAFRYLATYTWSQSREPLNVIEAAIQSSVGDASARKQLETRLAAVLRSGAPFPAKQYASRKLSQIGTADSIPILAPLLVDPALSHPARLALERIAHPGALEALRGALPKAEDKVKIGIISSLGALRDPGAVDSLSELLAGRDSEIAKAAALALGSIGTLDAAKALERSRNSVSKDLQPTATHALLVAASRLPQGGQGAEAARIYTQLRGSDEAAQVRLAAFKGLLAAHPERALELLGEAIAGEDERERNFASLRISDRSATPDVKQFIDAFQKYSTPARIALLEAFRFRSEAAARPAALAAADSSDAALRLAGLRALTTIGTAADVPMLARRAAGQEDEKLIAEGALASLPARQVDDAILELLPGSPPDITVELLNALVARGAAWAAGAIAKRLTDSDPRVRAATLKSLGELGGAAQIPAVLNSLRTSANDSDREMAQDSLAAIAQRAGPGCAEELLPGLEGTNPESRIALLRTLGIADGPKALAAVRAHLSQSEARVKEAAFRVLVDWSTIDAGPELLQLAQTSAEPNWRVLAFRGCVRLCREADSPAEERIRLLTEAMKTARDPEEKRLVIAACGGQQDLRVLQVVTPCLDEAALAQEACLALVTFADSIEIKEKSQIVPALKRVVRVSTNHEVREKARSLLQQLGEKAE